MLPDNINERSLALQRQIRMITDQFVGQLQSPDLRSQVRHSIMLFLVGEIPYLTFGPAGDLECVVDADPQRVAQGYMDVSMVAHTLHGKVTWDRLIPGADIPLALETFCDTPRHAMRRAVYCVAMPHAVFICRTCAVRCRAARPSAKLIPLVY